jgi:diguanylate cyclase (GGDEF)-like protein
MRLTRVTFPERRDARSASFRVLVYAAVLLLLALTFWLDRSIASAPIQHLYYVPIILACLVLGPVMGVVVSVAAIVLYHLANPAVLVSGYRETDVIQIGLFLAVGLVTAKLSDDARRFHQLATTDDLTGLHNLRSFESRLAALLRAPRLASFPLSMLVLDVDRLKSINDAHGHLAGAEAVQTVGQAIAAWLPADAFACRYGGDEFAVALPRCSGGEARTVADALRRQVSGIAPVLAGVGLPAGTLSISVGVACLAPGPRGIPDYVLADADVLGEALFRRADRELYAAKANGRNHVSVAACTTT